jgi:hypothetical protein
MKQPKLSRKSLHPKLPGVILVFGLAFLTSVGVYIAYQYTGLSPNTGEVEAKEFINALEEKDLRGAMSVTDPANKNGQTGVLYGLTMDDMGEDYQIVARGSKSGKNSFLFTSDKGRRYPYIRVIVIKKVSTWVVVSFLPNTTKPSMFSAEE